MGITCDVQFASFVFPYQRVLLFLKKYFARMAQTIRLNNKEKRL